MKAEQLKVLDALLSVPTVPFGEEAVIAQVRAWAKSRGIQFKQDPSGNVVLRHKRGRARATWAFAAHLDHPGFVVREARGRRLHAEFLGSVRREYFAGARVRIFTPDGSTPATVRGVKRTKNSPYLQCRLELKTSASVPAGAIGMWDFAPMEIRGNTLISRGCDDVVGAAAVLCAMDELIAAKGGGQVIGLLTRAEEVGFIGALEACEHRTIPAGALVVAIETSKAQADAPLGGGAVVRVGDAARTFDSSLTAHVTAIAAELAEKDPKFRFVRQLMPGGTCESTAYMMMGYRATGLCLPLGNYHNQGPRGHVAAERIDLTDFQNLVKLLVALGRDHGDVEKTDERLRNRLRDLLRTRGGRI